MLSEEEKKAIKKIEEFRNYYAREDIHRENFSSNENYQKALNETRQLKNDFGTVLNLITKLQKEVENQKEKRENQKVELAILNEKQKEMNKLINNVKSYEGQFKRQEKQIRELQKKNKEKDKQIIALNQLIDEEM